MHKEFLEKFNFTPPIIKSYNKNGVSVSKHTDNRGPRWVLNADGETWMVYHLNNHGQALQFYSHYHLAYGHVICTGLGFGTREHWLATKPEVRKITVLEKYKEVIDYHKDIGTQWSNKIEIINADANEYKGDCDFLSIDHYELADVKSIIESIKRVVKNISCKVMWPWMLEGWLDKGYIYNTEKGDVIYYQPWQSNDLYKSYDKLKTFLKLKVLPELSPKQLTDFVNVYWSRI